MKITLTLLILLSLFGCSSIVQMPGTPYSLKQAANTELDNDVRLLFLGFSNKHSETKFDLAKQADARSRNIMLDQAVNIVDIENSVRGNLEQEILLLESTGESKFNLREAANIALKGEVSSATFTQEWSPEVTLGTIDGKPITSPAQCTYKTNVSGAAVFYKVNPLKQKNAFSFSGNSSYSVEGPRCDNLNLAAKKGLYLKAVNNGIENVSHKIMNQLARTGKVVAAYTTEEKKGRLYVRLSVRPDDGAKPGARVSFFEFVPGPDGGKEKIPFGEGKIVNTTHYDAAYVEVTDTKTIAKLKRNTPIKIKYKDKPIWMKIANEVSALAQ